MGAEDLLHFPPLMKKQPISNSFPWALKNIKMLNSCVLTKKVKGKEQTIEADDETSQSA